MIKMLSPWEEGSWGLNPSAWRGFYGNVSGKERLKSSHSHTIQNILFSDHSSNLVVSRWCNSTDWDLSRSLGHPTPLFFPSKVAMPGFEIFELCPQHSKSNFPAFLPEKKKQQQKKQDQKQRAACGEMKRMFSFLFFHCLFPLTKQMPLYEFALGSATEELQGMRLLVQLEGPVRELFPSRLASYPASHSSTLSTQFWFYFFLLFLWLVSTTFMNNVQDARHEIWGMQTC